MLTGAEYCIVCKKVDRRLVILSQTKERIVAICEECAEEVIDTFTHWDDAIHP